MCMYVCMHVRMYEKSKDRYKQHIIYCTKCHMTVLVWCTGMILPLGGRGPGLKSRNQPFAIFLILILSYPTKIHYTTHRIEFSIQFNSSHPLVHMSPPSATRQLYLHQQQ